MMLNDYFIKQSIKEVEIDEFIRKTFPLGDYSKTELQRTPLGIKIVIHTNKPGRIIGRGGKNINDMTEALKNRFGLENPQLDVKAIDNPNLDAKIVAKQISSALERGYNYKKIGNLTVKRIIGAGAIGVQILISGKLGGGKGMRSKFLEGYIKHAGAPVDELVDEGFEEAHTKPGKIGIRVRIVKEFIDITGEKRNYVQKTKDLVQAQELEENKNKPKKNAKKKPNTKPDVKSEDKLEADSKKKNKEIKAKKSIKPKKKDNDKTDEKTSVAKEPPEAKKKDIQKKTAEKE